MESELVPFLNSERLFYAKVSEEHAHDSYLSWMHDSEVNYFIETGKYPETIDSLKDYINKIPHKEVLFLAIHKKKDKKHIGNIKIDSINRIHSIAEYGILLGDKSEWGKGYAKEATITILNHCFNVLNIRKITLGVIAGNDSAINLYKKLGFEIEGQFVDHYYCNGEYRDVFRMGLFKGKIKW